MLNVISHFKYTVSLRFESDEYNEQQKGTGIIVIILG